MWYVRNGELYHYGIKGQVWGVRNGPPYPLKGGTFVAKGKKHYRPSKFRKNTKNNKLHVDRQISRGTKLQSLTRDEKRFEKINDYFYATYDKIDNAQFQKCFNTPIKELVYDDSGKAVQKKVYKFKAELVSNRDIKVASTDSQAKAFGELFKKNRDFYNFCTDPNRMIGYIGSTPWKWILNDGKPGNAGYYAVKKWKHYDEYHFTQKEVDSMARVFTSMLAYDGTIWNGHTNTGKKDESKGKDMATQRAKFFNELKKSGYGAMTDSMDAVDMNFKSNAPVVVFDMEGVTLNSIRRLTVEDVKQAGKDFSKVKRYLSNFGKEDD